MPGPGLITMVQKHMVPVHIDTIYEKHFSSTSLPYLQSHWWLSQPSFLRKNIFRYIIQISGKLLVIEFFKIFVIHILLLLLYIRNFLLHLWNYLRKIFTHLTMQNVVSHEQIPWNNFVSISTDTYINNHSDFTHQLKAQWFMFLVLYLQRIVHSPPPLRLGYMMYYLATCTNFCG